jgi:phage shock protein A
MIATCRGKCAGSKAGGGGSPLSIGIAREYHAGREVATDGVLPYADSAMGIFARLGSLLKSNINDLISKAEDPEKMLSQVLLDMQQQLVEAKKQVAVAIADEKRLQKQAEAESEKSKEWERKAMVAVRAGDDVLAKEALMRKQEHETISTQYQNQWMRCAC